MLTFRISPGKSILIPSSDAAEAGLYSVPEKEYRNCGKLVRAFPRRESPGYAARQMMQVEKTMKPLPHSPLIHPLVSHLSSRLFTWHAVAILVLAAWALQLIHFAVVIVRWRIGYGTRPFPGSSNGNGSGRNTDRAIYFVPSAEHAACIASTSPR